MKKFSTAARLTVLVSLLAPLIAAAAGIARCEFLQNAPDQHVVVRGDTLWGISGKFLEHPWCWPQVWGMNREQIRDPHWIYPGQIVYFDRAAGRLRLGTPAGAVGAAPADGSVGGIIRLQPQLRSKPIGRDAITSIPAGVIEPFLTQPLIVEENEMASAPRIVATPQGRVNIGTGDKVYVLGELDGSTMFHAFRTVKPLKDPVSKEIIGYEAAFLGTLKLVRDGSEKGEAHIMNVINAKEELGVGDRLLPIKPTPLLNYVPHPPGEPIEARVVSVYGGVVEAGQNQVVSINRGSGDGLDIGTVLELYGFGRIVADRTDDKRPIKLPDERYGSLFVFRLFDHMAYGLIMEVSEPVLVGDLAKSPE